MASANALFTSAVRTWQTRMSAANTNRDGSGTLYTLGQAGANGSLLSRITFQALVSTAAGTLRVFVNGNLLAEVTTAGASVSGTVPGENHSLSWVPELVLAPYATVQVCTDNTETWAVYSEISDF